MTVWSWSGGQLELTHGRVLQVVVGGEPAFWTAAQPDGWNVGGDRLWFGPERDWFWATDDHTDLSGHAVPPEIDPGTWRTSVEDRRAELVMDVPLTHRRSGTVTRVHVRREIELLATAEDHVSYRTRTALDVLAGRPVSAWSIVAVPDGGVAEVFLAGPLAYRDYLEPVDPATITDHGDRVAITLTGRAMFKIGFGPRTCAGRVRYSRPVAGGVLHVDRVLAVRPDLPYCDGQGDAVQIFDDDGHYGGYAELEHHSPAAVTGHTVDVCTTTVRLDRLG